jgi:hypothetical protein
MGKEKERDAEERRERDGNIERSKSKRRKIIENALTPCHLVTLQFTYLV